MAIGDGSAIILDRRQGVHCWLGFGLNGLDNGMVFGTCKLVGWESLNKCSK